MKTSFNAWRCLYFPSDCIGSDAQPIKLNSPGRSNRLRRHSNKLQGRRLLLVLTTDCCLGAP
ncbi:unnamed protein product, partial [Nesidiocoris tenuis]